MNAPKETVTREQMVRLLAEHIASKLAKDDLVSLAMMLDNDVGNEFHHWIQVECKKVAPELYVESDHMADTKLKVASLIDVDPMASVEEMANRYWPSEKPATLAPVERAIASLFDTSEQLKDAEYALGFTLSLLDDNLPPDLPPELLERVQAAGRRLINKTHCSTGECHGAEECRCLCDRCTTAYCIAYPISQREKALLFSYLKDLRERKAKESL